MSDLQRSMERALGRFEPFHPCHTIDTEIVRSSAYTPWGLYQVVARNIHVRVLGIVQRVRAAKGENVERVEAADAVLHALDLARELHRLCEWEAKLAPALPHVSDAEGRYVAEVGEAIARRAVAHVRGEAKTDTFELLRMGELERARWSEFAALGEEQQRAWVTQALAVRDTVSPALPTDVSQAELIEVATSCLDAGRAMIERAGPALELEAPGDA